MRLGNTPFCVDLKMTATNGGDADCFATGLPSQSIPQFAVHPVIGWTNCHRVVRRIHWLDSGIWNAGAAAVFRPGPGRRIR